jgi:hypothetical protein
MPAHSWPGLDWINPLNVAVEAMMTDLANFIPRHCRVANGETESRANENRHQQELASLSTARNTALKAAIHQDENTIEQVGFTSEW